MHHALNKNTGSMNLIWIQFTHFTQHLNFSNGDLSSHSTQWVEIPCSLAIDQITGTIALPGFDQSHIRGQTAFHDVFLTIELAYLFTFGHQSAHASFGKKSWYAAAASAQFFSQRTLRRKLKR